MKTAYFSQAVLEWYDEYGRKALPWKRQSIAKKHRPYYIWLSEVMLQQTQVATVIPYFRRFTKQYPSLQKLAQATQNDVLNLWAGLGYYARGRNLHKAAQSMWAEYQAIPNDYDALLNQPGIGRSTAGAIMAQAFQQRYPILDGNVKRVLARFHTVAGWPGKSSVAKVLWKHSEQHTPAERVAAYTQAIMDLGALICTRSKPQCQVCPLRKKCSAYKLKTQSEYPASKPKKEKPIKSVHVLCELVVAKRSKKVSLLQRPPSGIWGGLWSFPEFESLQLLEEYLERHYGKNESDLESLEAFRHTFSHYHLDIHPHVLSLSPKMYQGQVANIIAEEAAEHSVQLFDLSQPINVGLPAPMQKLLEQIS